jgi:hypothetical protein
MKAIARRLLWAAIGAAAAALLVMAAAHVLVSFDSQEPTGKTVSFVGVVAAIAGALLGARLADECQVCNREK